MSRKPRDKRNGKPQAGTFRSSGYSILLAEDDVEMRTLLARTLRKDGYRVEECADGFELLRHLEPFAEERGSVGFDLIVSDIRMPGFSGLEISDFIHDSGSYPPIVLITAFGDEQTHAKARELGVAAMFDKPFSLEDFSRSVREILERHKAPHNESGSAQYPTAHRGYGFPLDVVFRRVPKLTEIRETIYASAAKLKDLGKRIIFCRVIVSRIVLSADSSHYHIRLILAVEGQVFVVSNGHGQQPGHVSLKASIEEAFSIALGKVTKYLSGSLQPLASGSDTDKRTTY